MGFLSRIGGLGKLIKRAAVGAGGGAVVGLGGAEAMQGAGDLTVLITAATALLGAIANVYRAYRVYQEKVGS